MNCNIATKNTRINGARAFTLIEMIGVLAVIAILAALLVPKVFSAINDARINSVCINCDTIKTAVADHYGKYGKMDWIYGTNQITMPGGGIYAGYDTNVLLAEGLIDKPFVAKIAGGDPQTTSNIQLVTGTHENGAAGYQLDGVTNCTAGAQYVIEARLDQVTAADAKELNDRIDGTALGAPFGQTDNKGRVEYAQPVGGVTTVYVYLTHR
jgi:prepilin-type N-terminal cleavage/methylation domain-containing protein